jgi:hypothetical protein
MYLNIIKAMYDKCRTKLILNGEKQKLFPVKSGMRKWFPFSPLLFNIVQKILARAVRQEKDRKGISQITCVFAEDMIF